jgi:hypothetical protein
MTLTAQHPPGGAGAARGVLLGGKIYSLDSTPRVRLQHLAKGLHSLGPVALTYFLEEIDRGRDLLATLEGYAALAPYADLIRAYAVAPPLFVIEGGRA